MAVGQRNAINGIQYNRFNLSAVVICELMYSIIGIGAFYYLYIVNIQNVTWSLTLREDHRLRVFENRVPRMKEVAQ
jgi:uncharacterized membrane protein YjgN (DUF898 family)